MILSFLLCSIVIWKLVASQNESSEYVVDLGYAKYQGALNETYAFK